MAETTALELNSKNKISYGDFCCDCVNANLLLSEVDEILEIRIFSVASYDFVGERLIQQRLHGVWKYEACHRNEHFQEEEHKQEK